MSMAGNVGGPLGSVWICGFYNRVFARPCSWESLAAAINVCFCGRIMDLPGQSETSEIDSHWNYWKTLLKITLKMSRGEKKRLLRSESESYHTVQYANHMLKDVKGRRICSVD